jgi:hypothetical protein
LFPDARRLIDEAIAAKQIPGAVWLVARGGHEKVGTCQFSTADMDQKIPQLIDEIVNYHNYRS